MGSLNSSILSFGKLSDRAKYFVGDPLFELVLRMSSSQ